MIKYHHLKVIEQTPTFLNYDFVIRVFVDERSMLWNHACSDRVTWSMMICMSNVLNFVSVDFIWSMTLYGKAMRIMHNQIYVKCFKNSWRIKFPWLW